MANSTLMHLLLGNFRLLRFNEQSTASPLLPVPAPSLRQITYQKALALLEYSEPKSRTCAEVAGTIAGVEFP